MSLTSTTDGSAARTILNNTISGIFSTIQLGTQTNKATISYTTDVARTLTIPSLTGNRTFGFINEVQVFTAAQTFRASNSIRVENASTQDAIVFAGRAGGTGSFAITVTPTTLTGSRIYTLPDAGTNADFVMTAGSQTIGGTKTFSSTITGSINGNANTATSLETTRTIWGQNFNGTANVSGNLTSVGNITGTSSLSMTATNGTLSLSSTGTNLISFSTNSTERARITGTGNFGIGTTDPARFVEIVQGTSATETILLQLRSNFTDTNTATTLRFTNSTTNTAGSAEIVSIRTNTSSNGTSDLIFRVSNGNTLNEILRVKGNSQRVGINTSEPGATFHSNGTIRYTNIPSPGTITALGYDSNGDLKAASSSLRYKKDIETYTKGLTDLLNLNPVYFKYLEENKINAGLIAEDIYEKGFHEFVIQDENGNPDHVIYANIVVLLINAIKDICKRLDNLDDN